MFEQYQDINRTGQTETRGKAVSHINKHHKNSVNNINTLITLIFKSKSPKSKEKAKM